MKKIIKIIGISLFFTYTIIAIVLSANKNPDCSGPNLETRVECRSFSNYDGSHKNLVKEIRAELKLPESFSHQETRYKVENNEVYIECRYSAKSSAGLTISMKAIAIADTVGNIKSIKKVRL